MRFKDRLVKNNTVEFLWGDGLWRKGGSDAAAAGEMYIHLIGSVLAVIDYLSPVK